MTNIEETGFMVPLDVNTCDICGKEVGNDDLINIDGVIQCPDCISGSVTTCVICDCPIVEEDITIVNSQAYCKHCAEGHESNLHNKLEV